MPESAGSRTRIEAEMRSHEQHDSGESRRQLRHAQADGTLAGFRKEQRGVAGWWGSSPSVRMRGCRSAAGWLARSAASMRASALRCRRADMPARAAARCDQLDRQSAAFHRQGRRQ